MNADIDLARIAEAAQVVDPVFRDSLQFISGHLSGALGRDVLVKIETVNPLGSFKGRGADFLMRSLPRGAAVVCASSGNFGVALAYAGRARGGQGCMSLSCRASGQTSSPECEASAPT
jgi:threonine dehydratase